MDSIDLFELIHMRSRQLRKVTENRWNACNDIYLSESEWFILSQAYKVDHAVVADITKQMDISRQATHKFVHHLADKGLVTIGKLKNNKKAKTIQLTAIGKECIEKKQAMKKELENEIANNLGGDQINNLKDILQKGWGL